MKPNQIKINSRNKPFDYYSAERQDMRDYVPQGARVVLEVGCGEGNFGALLKSENNIEVWGVEVCQDAASAAQKKLDKIFTGDIESQDVALPESYFDCIIFNDSLEHLRDPWKVLEKMRACLKGGGVVVASIPNIRYFPILRNLIFQGEWKYVASGTLDKTHLRFFTASTIRDLFESTGYRITRIVGMHPLVFPWKFRLINSLCWNKFSDMRYLHWACIAQKI